MVKEIFFLDLTILYVNAMDKVKFGYREVNIRIQRELQFDIPLRPLTLHHNALGAEIEDDALFRYDNLRGGNGESADILLSSNMIVLNGVDIPAFQVDDVKCLSLVVADDV